jgi:phosphotriesterase-related protein
MRFSGNMMKIHTANGAISVNDLGKTLTHEHLVMAMAGWDSDTSVPPRKLEDLIEICVDRIEELQAAGFSSLLDPCPMDIGRDVELYAAVSVRTGFNILFSTGIYNEHLGGAYWRYKLLADPNGAENLAALYVNELTEGVGPAKLKPAVIKLAIGTNPDSAFEAKLITAAVIACKATGAPILAHTDGVGGDILLDKLTTRGIPAHRIIIAHCCGSADAAYHRRIVDGGSYIGFDRFGLEMIQSDEVRIQGLTRLLQDGFASQVLVSHDCAFCQRGRVIPDAGLSTNPLHFSHNIAPRLIERGVTQETIDSLLLDNPRRFFSGETPLREVTGSGQRIHGEEM